MLRCRFRIRTLRRRAVAAALSIRILFYHFFLFRRYNT
jgi:hypothetical protein